MNSRLRLFTLLLLPCLGLLLAGCVPQGQSDEEKEPHFLAGKSRVSMMDYPGAIQAFEKALDANPHNAAAHFELGCLYDQEEPNPAAAIYHYETFLKLRPNAGNVDVVKQRIMACKQAIASTVSLGPVNEKFQREFEQLTEGKKKLLEENKRLQDQNEQLRAALNRAAAQGGVPPSGTTAPNVQTPGSPSTIPGATPRGPGSTPVSPTRSYTVKAGDTLSSIARRYGITLDQLTAVNPNVNPRRLQIGHVLAIP